MAMATDENEDRLADFRLNVQYARKAAKVTQAELADAMKGRGFAFQQQTVQKIENGTRTVRLDEAAALAELLMVGLDDLLMPPTRNYGLTLQDRLDGAKFRLREAVKAYMLAQTEVARYVDEVDPELLGDDDAAEDVLEAPRDVVDFAVAEQKFRAGENLRFIAKMAEALPDQPKYRELARTLRENRQSHDVGPLTEELNRRRREAAGGLDPEAS